MDDAQLVEAEEQFWIALREILERPCNTHTETDDILRSFLEHTTQSSQDFLRYENDIARCCYELIAANVFQADPEYVRRQILYGLMQEDDVAVLHICAAILLFDGRRNDVVFELMQDESAFPCLVKLIRAQQDDNKGLHRLLLELFSEMSRIQKVDPDELQMVDDTFVLYLLDLIEQLSDDASDPYHYPIIRVLLVLNEQYMCLTDLTTQDPKAKPVTNRVLKVLSMHGSMYRTFGENLILLLNRESAPTSQLLILKLLYLLFTTPPTYEYFYTNDLHVLVDVIIRNLLDLDPGNSYEGGLEDTSEKDVNKVLRHTYLRVLCPLLKNTQLGREGGNYKREEVRKLLYLLVNQSSAHFAPVDETILRLVLRCRQIEWIRDEADEMDEQTEKLEKVLSAVAPKDSDVAKRMLGMSNDQAAVSSLSVADVSAKIVKAKPAIPAPRRKKQKVPPPPPSGVQSAGLTVAHASLQVPLTRTDSPSDRSESVQGAHSPFSDEFQDT